MTWQYWVMVVSLIIGGGFLFFVMAHLGEKMLQRNDEREKEEMRQRMATAQLQGFTNLSINLNEYGLSPISPKLIFIDNQSHYCFNLMLC